MAQQNQDCNHPLKLSKVSKKSLNDEIIFDVRDEDILCGKEKHCVSHPGSFNFRVVIDKYAFKYQEAITKQEKMIVTKEIYDSLTENNSRFLKFKTEANGWEELSSLLARDKISHALRFANREKKAAPSNNSPRTRKGHRRTGSDSSASTLTTVASELSLEDFDYLVDDEPLEWSTEAITTVKEEPKPYAYPVYELAPPAPPTVYHPYSQPYVHPHSYRHGYYPPPAYHHSYHHPQQDYVPSTIPQVQPEHHQYQEMQPMFFPEKPRAEPLAKESSMDVDLSYIMTEPLMDWDLEPEQMCLVNDQ